MAPTQAAVYAMGPEDDHGGEVAKYRKQLMDAKVVYVCVPRPPEGGHYTYLKIAKTDDKAKPHVEYKDALECPSFPCAQTAKRILQGLGYLDTPVPEPSNRETKDYQEDGWSCGLHVLKWIEQDLRQTRGEPRLPPATLTDIRVRVNVFIEMIKTAIDAEGYDEERKEAARAAAKAAAAKEKKQNKKTHDEEEAKKVAVTAKFANLEEALQAAHDCTSCYYSTQWLTKGCTRCMGYWFEEIRTTDGKGNKVVDLSKFEPAPADLIPEPEDAEPSAKKKAKKTNK